MLSQPEALQEPVLSALPRVGADPDGDPGHRRQRSSPVRPSSPARSRSPARRSSSDCCRASVSRTRPDARAGPDLPAARQLAAARRRAVRGPGFQVRRDLARGLRRLRHRSDGDRLTLIAFFLVWRYWSWPLWQTAAADRSRCSSSSRRSLPPTSSRYSRAPGVPLLIAGLRQPHHGDVGARLRPPARKTHARTRRISIGCCASWRPSRHTACRAPPSSLTRRSDRRAHGPDAQPEAQPHAPRAQYHPLHPDRGDAARAALRARQVDRVDRDRSSGSSPRYSFMETPSVPKILESAGARISTSTSARRRSSCRAASLKTTRKSEMPRWQERLVHLARRAGAQDATTYFKIPSRPAWSRSAPIGDLGDWTVCLLKLDFRHRSPEQAQPGQPSAQPRWPARG